MEKIIKQFAAICLVCMSFCIFSSVSAEQNIDDLILMSEQFPPYNFEEDGKLQGTSIDLMCLILKKMGSIQTRKNIEILPWARSYKALLEKKNSVLFAVTRTAEREHLFKWVGPISNARNVLIARKDRNIRILSADDAKKYKMGVVRDDAGEQLVITKLGIKRENLDITSNGNLNIRKLNVGRIDLFAYDENVARWIIKKEGFDIQDFETVYILEEGFHYFAFHKDTSDSLIIKIQCTLDKIKKRGEYYKILGKYFK